MQGYDLIGRHFFANVSGTSGPIFDFDRLQKPSPEAILTKIGEADPPKEDGAGGNEVPAIKCLYLRDTTGLSRGGIHTAYRVKTAGGNKPASCRGMPSTFEAKYSALCKLGPMIGQKHR